MADQMPDWNPGKEENRMREIERRGFLKLTGTGVGAVIISSLFHDRLLAGTIPEPTRFFEEKFGISSEIMKKILDAALSRGGDFADLFFEYKQANSVVMEDDIIKESTENIILGVGIRVLNGEQTGYGYTSDLTLEKMKQAALTAGAIAASGSKTRTAGFKEIVPNKQVNVTERLLATLPLNDKIGLVKEAYAATMAHDTSIKKAVATLADELQYVMIANSEGLLISDKRPQTRLSVRATAENNGVRDTGSSSAGGRIGMAFYETAGTTPKEVGVRAAQEALTLLSAVNPIPGDQPVVLGKDHSGVMVHEAVGHPLEADSNWRKLSIMWDKLGTMVASPLVTIYDDATIPYYRGSLNIDDEGTPTVNAMLIEKGKLVGYLHDRLSARIMKMKPNGHGRRHGFGNIPIPRMNNTILGRGDSDPEEIIKSVKKGFFADTYFGGEVEDTGKFTFSVNLGFMIEDGKLTRPVKNATLIGTNVQILKEVEMIGNDMGFFLGTCGKDGQSAHVTAGLPTIKIRQMTVGGRS